MDQHIKDTLSIPNQHVLLGFILDFMWIQLSILIHVTLSVPSAIQVGFMYIFIKYSHKMCQCKNDCHKWFSVSPPHTLLLAPITVLLRSMHALHIKLVASTAQTTPSCGLIMFPSFPSTSHSAAWLVTEPWISLDTSYWEPIENIPKSTYRNKIVGPQDN